MKVRNPIKLQKLLITAINTIKPKHTRLLII